MAARADRVSYDRQHYFIKAGIWYEALRQEALLGEDDRLVGGLDALLVVDKTVFPENENRSVGGAPHYTTTLGKIANGRTLVSLTLPCGEVFVVVGLAQVLPET